MCWSLLGLTGLKIRANPPIRNNNQTICKYIFLYREWGGGGMFVKLTKIISKTKIPGFGRRNEVLK